MFKKVSATISLYGKANLSSENTSLSFPFNTINIDRNSKIPPSIGECFIVSDFNFAGDFKNFKIEDFDLDNIMCLIRLSKINRNNSQGRYSWDIATFDVDARTSKNFFFDNNNIPYSSVRFISRVFQVDLKPNDYAGDYKLELLYKVKKTDDWEPLTTTGLKII